MVSQALLLGWMSLGINYGWQPAPEGGLEYIVQVEPSLVDALLRGQSLVSEIPGNVRNLRRVRVRIGNDEVPRQGVPLTAPSWQTAPRGDLELQIEINRDYVQAMLQGREYVSDIPPDTAGLRRCSIRVGEQTIALVSAEEPEVRGQSPVEPARSFAPQAFSNPPMFKSTTPAANDSNANTQAASNQPASNSTADRIRIPISENVEITGDRSGIAVEAPKLVGDSRFAVTARAPDRNLGSTETNQPADTQPNNRRSIVVDDNSWQSTGPAANEKSFTFGQARDTTQPAGSNFTTPPGFNGNVSAAGSNNNPANTATTQFSTGTNQATSQNGQSPFSGFSEPPRFSNQTTAPTFTPQTGQNVLAPPAQPSSTYSNFNQPNAATPETQPLPQVPQQQALQQQQTPQQQQQPAQQQQTPQSMLVASNPSPATTPTYQVPLPVGATNPGSLANAYSGADSRSKNEEDPWVPLMLTTLVLFASLSGNIYLGWMYWGVRERYQIISDQRRRSRDVNL